ncbi:PREDICTED: DNA repair protein REV1 [Rhagoletis zephyria]|uniref:DNA repair protein REV1 n=1 Tax=Rhagoletis zephyria TaxID=28612 RepID=UPI0008116B14|nr:PREDICTED: DNA repair protein REV1 [Rhagoletis zephyria]
MNANGFEQWGGYMEAKITKLEEQFSASSNPYRRSNLFAGISIYVNGLTIPSADELKRIMMVHGGTYHHYERSHTTYIIASNLPDVKVRNMNTGKIISPQWVVDCVKEMRILSYTRYLLYTNQNKSQPRLAFEKNKDETKNQAKLVKDANEIRSKDNTALKTDNNQIEKDFARTAVDPKFLSEFYNNSRLHHIATLGAGFKQYISDLRDQQGSKKFLARSELKQRLLPNSNTNIPSISWVMHIDMDCFFVSVGLRKHPELKGQPVAVTHSKGGASANAVPIHPGVDRKIEGELFAKRFEEHLHNNILSDKVRSGFEAKMSLSEIASCSYEARARGIRNGMFVGQALNLCPELKTIPYDFEGYREVSHTLYDTIAQYTLNIEAVSCDEMFVDLADVLDEIKVDPMDFVFYVREEVRTKTGCPCSAGVGGNKLQARMATKRAKPDGQYLLRPDGAEEYMADINIKDLPGVGSSTAYILKQNNLVTCGDLQKVSLSKLQMHVGKKFGETLYQFCRGIDSRPLIYGQIRKSVSAEVNYGIRFKESSELETFLRQLCTEVHIRLSDIKRRTKCITLKLMVRAKDAPREAAKFMGHGVCDHITKSVSLSDYTCDLDTITRTVLTTMKALELSPNELRGIGIQLSKLNDPNENKERKNNVILNMFSKVAGKQKEIIGPIQNDNSNGSATNNENEISNRNAPLNVQNDEVTSKLMGKRTRGRPVGSLFEKKSKKGPDILDLMQKAAAKQPDLPSVNLGISVTIPKDIDPDVFAALPLDIRAEILQAHSSSSQKLAESEILCRSLNESDFQPSTSKAAQLKQQRKAQEKEHKKHTLKETKSTMYIDPEFLDALPQSLRLEVEKDFLHPKSISIDGTAGEKYGQATGSDVKESPRTQVSPDNLFMQANCMELLLAWVKSTNVPETYDINLIASHAEEMVKAHEIDRLYTPLIYLCRLLNQQKSRDTTSECIWHNAYLSIINVVQKEMKKAYDGRSLFIGAKLKCDKCIAL